MTNKDPLTKKIIILSATMLFIAGSAFAQAELTIRQREVDGVRILDLQGKVTEGGGTASLRNAIRGLLNEGQRKFVLNSKGPVLSTKVVLVK